MQFQAYVKILGNIWKKVICKHCVLFQSNHGFMNKEGS